MNRSVHTSRKIKDEIKVKDENLPCQPTMHCLWSVIQIMSAIRSGTCTSISKNTKDQYGKNPEDIAKDLRILMRCQSKLDCLIFWNAFIGILKPKLNKQCDLLKTGTKLVTWLTWFDPPRTLNSIYKEGECEPIRSCCLVCISSGILTINKVYLWSCCLYTFST